MGEASIMSIPKDKSLRLSNSSSYRKILPFNNINKLFDYVTIDLCGETLLTRDMQFGYKPKHSTILFTTTCILMEIIDCYLRGN